MEEHQYTNRLSQEKSPYLQQHAHNPVDWYPWSPQAFELATQRDKPIFLSIGYATCHWCHVMEQEVFEDEELGKLMNEAFVNIKVDREEMPEVDALYMEFAQTMLGGAVGWPLNLVLTPELQPFYAATYMPAQTKHGLLGMRELIERIAGLWNSDQRLVVAEQAKRVVEDVDAAGEFVGEEMPQKSLVRGTVALLFKVIDPIYGGIKGSPKFPIGYQSSLLMRYFLQSQDSRALFCVDRTLTMMERGGIHDQLGGGFSRYSVDERWLVPHFEKMLYDNALLADCYREFWQVANRPMAQRVCRRILDYVLRDMTDPGGGFYSAEDADSEGREGLFYTWTPEEVAEHFPSDEASMFCTFYGLTNEGNFEGRNILFQDKSPEEFAKEHELNPESFRKRLEEMQEVLFQQREKRVRPFKDKKVLSSWNGLMIHSFALASAVFEEPKYLEAAIRSAEFLRENLWEDDHLYRRWTDGEARFHSGLSEYAFLIRGLLTLFEVDGNPSWLEWALEMNGLLKEEFKLEQGAYFGTDGTDPSIILRRADFTDGAEPSGNAVQVENLLRLYQLTSDDSYLEDAEHVLQAFNANFDPQSIGHCYHIMSLMRYYDEKSPTVVVALNEKEDHREEIARLFHAGLHPHVAIVWSSPKHPELAELAPAVKQQTPVDGKTTVYLCYQGACRQPMTEWAEIEEALSAL